ncbi:MAG: hypothetical protein IJR77_03665 [Bacteroidales bacterium]|nr:hypothetical protein [Bacteroidales bacterium]
MKTVIIVILAVAVLVLAAVAFLRKKQVNSLTQELESQRKVCDDLAFKYDKHLRRTVRLCADKPQKITAQYLAMKLSRLLDGFIIVDGDNCYLDVLTPEQKANE